MKKAFLLFAAFCLAIAASAQIRTYSSNDANHDGKVDIRDINYIINEIRGSGKPGRIVSVDVLRDLVRNIDPDVAKELEKRLGISDDPDTPTGTHDYVDLGLPSGTLWATCNVGATKPEDYGLYFAWGETIGYSDGHSFDLANYKWCNGSSTTMTKYCADSGHGTVDNKLVLESDDDAATANWGSEWQMPSFDQIVELFESSYVTTTWTMQNGVYGRLITSNTNGNNIFLPAAGYRENTSLNLAGEHGYYLTRELDEYKSDNTYDLSFYSDEIDWDCDSRYWGLSVRPVRVKESEPEPDPTPTPTDDNLLSGKFSVSATKQVQFTKSNLYWDGSDFKFEADQTDYPTAWNANHVGHFHWTNLTDYQSGTAAYMPYAEEYSYSSQSTTDKFWCGEDNPLTVEGTSGLYALTGGENSELYYLLKGRPNASSLYKMGVTVTNHGTDYANCLIIAPDDFDGKLQSSYTLDEVNAAGLVCLPAASNRDGSTFGDDGYYGNYWSATPDPCQDCQISAYTLYFDYVYIYPDDGDRRNMGYCLRLVKTVEASEPEPEPEPTPTDDNLFTGKFSVSTDKQVQFTKGNLYWNGSNFRFGANQTDYPKSWDENYVGHFYWTKTAEASYALSYSDGDCANTDKFFADGSDADHMLTVEGTSDLYVLSSEEWNYLINSRTNATSLYKNDVTVTSGGTSYESCLIIAPDDYTGTLQSSYTLSEVNAAGLVCLPPAGYRQVKWFDAYGSYGGYWSSSPYTIGYSLTAYYLDFRSMNTSAYVFDAQRNCGSSIRLVRDIK